MGGCHVFGRRDSSVTPKHDAGRAAPLCRQRSRNRLEKQLINVTPAPILARLERLDHGMVRRMKMLCRVSILRIVAAADVTARDAKSQMNPPVARFQTLFTTVRRFRSNVVANLE